ncbi:MAG TPA: Asp-tRNA(Asn)/Glu-tRNA(Gln) amidotransferase subunit GatB [Nitrococcus sp.]|nr:Asp-tRNA(Asn)/Glu-tRNA(Gln) amidotransferase subunit GatB [Nitrococcus sp.]
MNWEPVIGLEIHVQLATKTKIFSGASVAYGAAPNTQACAIDLGLPGVLPVLNEQAVRMAVKLGLALDAVIAPCSNFARKNYFYPDLPKGYQISQYELPVVADGHLDIELEDGEIKRIGIIRAHLEEDAGKSLHEGFEQVTAIDLNRAGTPLIEVVSAPDMCSAKEAVAYMKKLHSLVRYLEISDGNMQEGSFRCDANISVRPLGERRLGTRTEVKNVNSFRFVERAINYEIQRQIELLEDGGEVIQETRLFDPSRNETRTMRTKEEANDYRYFPDPDLLPLEVSPALIEEVRRTLPELPDAKRERFMREYELTAYDSGVLTASRAMADYFEAVAALCGDAKLAGNWVMGELSGALNKAGLDIAAAPVSPAMLGTLLQRIEDGTLSGKIAKEVFEAMWNGEGEADAVIERRGLKQLSDRSAIAALIDEIIAANPSQVQQYRAGKERLIGFFVGQVMKASKGQANPQMVNELLQEKLGGG